MRYGVIAIETDYIVTSVFENDKDIIIKLYENREYIGLCNYIKNNNLSCIGIGIILKYIKSSLYIIEKLKCKNKYCYATSCLRYIKNNKYVCKIIKNNVKIDVDILSSFTQTQINCTSITHQCNRNDGIACNIGGGSIQLYSFSNSKLDEYTSMPVGASKIYKEYVNFIIPTSDEVLLITEKIEDILIQMGKISNNNNRTIYITGNIVEEILKLYTNLSNMKKLCTEINISDIEVILDIITNKRIDGIKILKNSCPNNFNTILPAIYILKIFCKIYDIENIIYEKTSNNYGYIMNLLNNELYIKNLQ